MPNSTWAQRIKTSLLKPKQVMIVDSNGGKPAKNWSFRPITFILTPASLIGLGLVVGSIYLPTHQISDILPQQIQLQRQLKQLHDQLAISEASNDVKQAQIDSLESEIRQQQDKIGKLYKRLNIFESILKTRKGHETQLLQASVQHAALNQLTFTVILVKGGSYPRYVSGSIQFITKNKQGKTITLLFDEGKDKLPYRMETHTFLRGKLHWPKQASIPEQDQPLTVILSDHKGRELTRTICTFEEL